MILSKDLLLTAFEGATFVCSGAVLNRQQPWNFYQQDREVFVAVDSRLLGKNDIFVALKGQTTDGHAFLDAAIKEAGVNVKNIV